MDKLFVERYMDYVNKSPLMRDLELHVFEYISMYNKIQQMHALYFKNLKLVNDSLVQSLDNYKDEINALKNAHSKIVAQMQDELLKYYKDTHEITAVLRVIYGTMQKLSKLKFRFLEQHVLSTKDKIEIMYHLINNPDYKKLVTEFLMSLKRFDTLNYNRSYKCGMIFILMDAVKTLQEDLVETFDVNKYDLMANVNNQKFIKYVEAQLVFQDRLMSDLSGMETVLKSKLLPKLAHDITEFKKDHRVDPNFAVEELSDGSFRQTFQRYLKLSRAIERTKDSIEREIKDISMRTEVAPNGMVVKQPLHTMPMTMTRGWQLRHPKIIKMVAERDALSDLMTRRRSDVSLKLDELKFALTENGSAIVAFGGGGKKQKGKKNATDAAKKLIKGYLDYAEIQQALVHNKAKYSQVLTQLYGVRDALNKNEYIAALDGAVNELQSEVDKARLAKILAASKEADYQAYIRELTEDNPTLAKLAKHNNYASFLVKKGKVSSNEYFEELEDANMDNYRKQTERLMTSAHNEDLLKKSVKTMIKNAYMDRSKQSVFDLASNGDDRVIEVNRPILFGGTPEKLNPMVFNPFSLVGDETQCLRVMKSGRDEIVKELKTMLKMKYQGVELQRALVKVDLVADRIMELLKKDRCSPGFHPTMIANITESLTRLACTLRCQHVDVLESVNWKAGVVGKQTNEALSLIVRRLIDVECPRLCTLGEELTKISKISKKNAADVKKKATDCLKHCLVPALNNINMIEETAHGSGKYKLSTEFLNDLGEKMGLDVRDIPLREYDINDLSHLVPLVKDVEFIMKKIVWAQRDTTDMLQAHAVDSATKKKLITKHCLHIHDNTKKLISSITANYLDANGDAVKADEKELTARKDLYAEINEYSQTFTEITENQMKTLIHNVHNDKANDLYKLMEKHINNEPQNATYVRLYEMEIEGEKAEPLYKVLDVSDHEHLKELLEAINTANSFTAETDNADAVTAVNELLKQKVSIPTIIYKLYTSLTNPKWKDVYEVIANQANARLTAFKNNNFGKEIEINNDAKTALVAACEAAHDTHLEMLKNTWNVIGTKATIDRKTKPKSLKEDGEDGEDGEDEEGITANIMLVKMFLTVFQGLNSLVYCLFNAVVPKEEKVSCAKATVGNSMEIGSLIELGRRLHVITDDDDDTKKLLTSEDLVNQLQELVDLIKKERSDDERGDEGDDERFTPLVSSVSSVSSESSATGTTPHTLENIIENEFVEYLAAKAKVKEASKIFERKDKKDLLELLEKGKHLESIGQLMGAQRELTEKEEKLRAKLYNFEKNVNMYHKSITKSFNRYNQLIRKKTDHARLLGEVMKFIDLWNKCHTDCSKKTEKPLKLLIERIATNEEDAMKKLTGEFTKYLGNGNMILKGLLDLCVVVIGVSQLVPAQKGNIKEEVKKAKETLKKDFSKQAAYGKVDALSAASHLSDEKIEKIDLDNNNLKKGGRRRVSKKRPTRTVKRSHRK